MYLIFSSAGLLAPPEPAAVGPLGPLYDTYHFADVAPISRQPKQASRSKKTVLVREKAEEEEEEEQELAVAALAARVLTEAVIMLSYKLEIIAVVTLELMDTCGKPQKGCR